MDLTPDTVVDDRYQVEARLGEGGMAVVWRVRHLQLGTLHALKVLQVASPAIRRRMLQEGRLQGNLRHPSVVAVTDVVTVGGAPGLVMELVEGPSLDRLLATRRLSVPEVDVLARGILDGAAAAHAAGLVHRDLKPGNVLVAASPSGLVPKIADFGLAKALASDRSAIATRSGVAMGSPAYMAPEQIRDASSVDARADVFALGVLLYEMLAGVRPFEGGDTFALYERITRGEHAPITDLVPDLPERMAAAVEGALRVSPEERFADAGALRDAWTGTAGAAHVTWDPALLEAASALTSRPPPETDSRATVDLDALPAEPQRSPPGRRLAWLALLLLVVPLVAVWTLLPRSADQFTATDVPVLAEGAATDALRRAWTALLDADLPLAVREARALVTAHPDALEATLVLYAALRVQGRHSEADELLVAPGLHLEAHQGELAVLARAAASRSANEQVLAWSRAHPHDLLGRLLVAEGRSYTSGERLQDALGFRDDHPDLAVAWLLAARRLRVEGREDEATAALDHAVELAPGSAWLAYETGRLLALQQRWEASGDALRGALERDPSLTDARARLAMVLLQLGDDAGAARETDALRTAPVEDRLAFAQDYAFALLGHGRLSDALAMTGEAAALAEDEARWSALGRLALAEFTLHDVAQPYTPAHRDSVERLRSIAALPGMPASFAQHLQTSVVAVDAEFAAIEGDLERARILAARLEAMGAELQANRAASTIALAEGEEVGSAEECLAVCLFAHTLEAGFGRTEEADRVWSQLAFDTCGPSGLDRACAAEGRVRHAEMALASDDTLAAREHVARARELWRAPDPDLPAARRLAAVEDALGERR